MIPKINRHLNVISGKVLSPIPQFNSFQHNKKYTEPKTDILNKLLLIDCLKLKPAAETSSVRYNEFKYAFDPFVDLAAFPSTFEFFVLLPLGRDCLLDTFPALPFLLLFNDLPKIGFEALYSSRNAIDNVGSVGFCAVGGFKILTTLVGDDVIGIIDVAVGGEASSTVGDDVACTCPAVGDVVSCAGSRTGIVGLAVSGTGAVGAEVIGGRVAGTGGSVTSYF